MATSAATPPRAATANAFPLKYFVLAFAFTWFFWGLQLLAVRGAIPALPGLQVVGTFGPMAAALLLTAREHGRAGVRSQLGRVARWRVAPVWYGVALLGPFALALAAVSLHVALGGQAPDPGALVGALPIFLVVFVYMLVFVALGEEVGWRGYALPALQARHGALVSSVILGIAWALWHLPLFFNPETFYSRLPFVLWLAYVVPFAVLVTWIFNSAGGSVLVAMIFHAGMNASGEVWKSIPAYATRPPSAAEAAAVTVYVNLMTAVVLWVAAGVVVFVYGARNLSRSPRQTPSGVGTGLET